MGIVNQIQVVLMISAFLCAATAFSQPPEKEPIAVVEVGVAPGWNLNDGGSSVGPALGFEFSPINKWLEIEAGVTAGFARHSTEWDTDLLFKKPWTLSKRVEFMFGLGPVWVHTSQPGAAKNSLAGEVALDFMFWPSRKRRFGWYLEPGYDYNFGPGHMKSAGISGGLLIAIP